jgi:hypothetical protein
MLFTKKRLRTINETKAAVEQVESGGPVLTLPGAWLTPRRTGRWYPAGVYSAITSQTGGVGTNINTLVFFWLPLLEDTALSQLMISSNQTASTQSFRFGLYADAGNGNPGDLLWDGGKFNFVGVGAQIVTCNQAVAAPGVWVCYSISSTLQMLSSSAFGVTYLGVENPENGRGYALRAATLSQHPPTDPLPQTAPDVVNVVETNIPVIYVKELAA